MKLLNKIWIFLDGKKTKIGTGTAILTGIMYVINGIWKETIPIEIIRGSEYITGALLGTGVTHKALKSNAGKSILNATKKLISK